jgi:putative DNA primase/helicase
LLVDANGRPYPHFRNCEKLIAASQEWQEVLAWNEFSQTVTALKPTPWSKGMTPVQWNEDVDTVQTMGWLQEHGLAVTHLDPVRQAISSMARRAAFHPIRDYLNGLEWDGEKRMDLLLTTLCVQPGKYAHDALTSWMISAVNRVFHPGCQADYMPVFWGRQGILKTSFIRELAGPWYLDGLPNRLDKDTVMAMGYGWLIEIPEFTTVQRADVEGFKAFVSRRTDVFRPIYGREPISRPRQCVLAGTTNHHLFLADPTGNRRFWPIHCDPPPEECIDVMAVGFMRDQLWAEAMRLWKGGRQGYITNPEAAAGAEEAQEIAYEPDILDRAVEDYAHWNHDDDGQWRSPIDTHELLADLVRVLPDLVKQKDALRRASMKLQMLGYRRFRPRRGAGRVLLYVR